MGMEPPSASLAMRVADEAAPQRRAPSLELVEASPPGLKARRLYEEARAASLEHLRALEAALGQVRTLTDAIVEAGDLYAPGVSQFATRLGEDLFWRAKTLAKLAQQQGG